MKALIGTNFLPVEPLAKISFNNQFNLNEAKSLFASNQLKKTGLIDNFKTFNSTSGFANLDYLLSTTSSNALLAYKDYATNLAAKSGVAFKFKALELENKFNILDQLS